VTFAGHHRFQIVIRSTFVEHHFITGAVVELGGARVH